MQTMAATSDETAVGDHTDESLGMVSILIRCHGELQKAEWVHSAVILFDMPFITVQNLSNDVMLSVVPRLTDSHGAADLLGDDNASEIIDTADNSGSFHIYILSFCVSVGVASSTPRFHFAFRTVEDACLYDFSSPC